jgi:hypothetical protein
MFRVVIRFCLVLRIGIGVFKFRSKRNLFENLFLVYTKEFKAKIERKTFFSRVEKIKFRILISIL